MDKIGFIGLGAMGEPMAWNIRDAGYELKVYNRTPEKMEPFDEEDIPTYTNPMELTNDSDVIIVMVTGPGDLIEVLERDDGVIAGIDGSETVINMSTVSPEATSEANKLVESQGADFVDSPVSGTVGPAEEGTLTVLASGQKEDIDRVRPVLETMGEPVIYCGETGKGTRMKLFINMLLGGMMETFSEALIFGKENGLETDKMFDVVESGAMDSPLFRVKGETIKKRDFDPRFTLDLLHKDLTLGLETAGEEDIPLPAIAASREGVNSARSLGYGDQDIGALIKYLEELTGTEVD